MPITPELLGIILSLICSMMATAVCYGSLKQQVNDLDRALRNHTADDLEVHKRSVTLELFRATVSPIKEDLQELKRDMKLLLNRRG